jgi:hypothetical protein
MDDMDEPILPEATDVNGTAAIRTSEGPEATQQQGGTNDVSAGDRGAVRPAFMSGLATAMREAAVRERERITGVVAADAETHIEKVRSRAAVESEELRRLAEEDVEHIEQWSTAEIERIRSEAAQKVDDRRSSLDEYLKQHDSIIETEIDGVNAAVRDYESTLDRFFAELSDITDPSEIVRRAGLLPQPPDLDEIRASARASAMAKVTESVSADSAEPAASTEPVAVAETPLIESIESVSAPADTGSEAMESVAAPAEPTSEGARWVESAGVAAEVRTPPSDAGDGGAMTGVMDDGASSVEPGESMESTPELEAPVAEETPAAVGEPQIPLAEEPAPEPVGVMDPDARRVPNWPAPAPEAPPAPVAPRIDNTSAAVRLLRSVAPWTAPTHAGNRGSGDSD